MRKVSVFNFTTLNGFFEGPKKDISWHKHDAEGSEYAVEGLKSGSTLLFGRITYELMASYWPTPYAMKDDPVVAEGMNRADKVVFSRTLKNADWINTRVVNGDLGDEVRKMKQAPGKDMTLMGSGSIVAQLAELGLVDEYQILVNPIALGDGTPIFKGIKRPLGLHLTGTRAFMNGNVLLCYEPGRGA